MHVWRLSAKKLCTRMMWVNPPTSLRRVRLRMHPSSRPPHTGKEMFAFTPRPRRQNFTSVRCVNLDTAATSCTEQVYVKVLPLGKWIYIQLIPMRQFLDNFYQKSHRMMWGKPSNIIPFLDLPRLPREKRARSTKS